MRTHPLIVECHGFVLHQCSVTTWWAWININSFQVLILSFKIWNLYSCSTCSIFAIDPGPENVNRTEGETDVLIDCTFSTNGTPIWRINYKLFDPFSLPTNIEPTINGLSVTRAERSLDQTRFQCFTPSGNGLHVSASSIGTLTVVAKSKLSAARISKHRWVGKGGEGVAHPLSRKEGDIAPHFCTVS